MEIRREIIRLENIHKYYLSKNNKIKALNGISIKLFPGQLAVIKGPSGSGKTTLLNIMSGLDTPDTGRVYFRDNDLNDINDKELTKLRRKNFGIIFQSMGLIEILTCYENIELPLKILKFGYRQREKIVNSYLDLFGLKERRNHLINELSGGEKQRVGMARSFVIDPLVIFADEPTSQLNQELTKEIMEIFKKTVKDKNSAACVVTHDPLVTEFADVIYEIENGNIINLKKN